MLNSTVSQCSLRFRSNHSLQRPRLVIRPSGTEPVIRVMAEGDDHRAVEQVVDEIVNVIAGLRTAA